MGEVIEVTRSYESSVASLLNSVERFKQELTARCNRQGIALFQLNDPSLRKQLNLLEHSLIFVLNDKELFTLDVNTDNLRVAYNFHGYINVNFN